MLLVPFAISCTKNEVQEENKDSVSTQVEDDLNTYYYKGEIINKSDIDFNNDHLYMVYGLAEKENDVFIFTSNIEFIEWCKSKSYNELSSTAQNIEKMQLYAKEVGEIVYLEKNGKLSSKFETFLQNETSFNRNSQRLGFLCKGYNGNGGCLSTFPVYPAIMPGGWSNTISSVDWVGGALILADKTFMRGTKKVFAGCCGTGNLQTHNFDDKTSSYK